MRIRAITGKKKEINRVEYDYRINKTKIEGSGGKAEIRSSSPSFSFRGVWFFINDALKGINYRKN